MKRFTFIAFISMLISFYGTSQNQATFDDIYFKPSDAKKMQKIQNNNKTPNEKNGAKEIIYIDRNNDNSKVVDNSQVAPGDTAQVLAEANDSTENNQQQGQYLNGFNGNQSDLEYAERIRRFHNPKYEIFIGDPRYNDIYFLNNNDWNVYVDGSYAYVTPTWTNPYWWDYNYNPYSWSSPFGYYNNWYNSPWGWDSGFGFGYGGWGYPYYGYGYGGFGYGYGYSGYGYGGYGYGGYPYYGYGYGGYPYYGGGLYSYKQHNPNHDEAVRREVSNLSPRRVGGSSSSSSVINSGSLAGSSRNPYTVITGGSGSRQQNITAYNGYGSRVVRNTLNSSGSTFNRSTGIGIVRSGGIRTNNLERTYRTTISTQPRVSASNQVYTNSNRSSYSRPATNNVYRSPSPSNNSYSRPSMPTYNSPAPQRSSSSFNSSSNSESFRSSSSSSSFSGGGGGGGATRSSSSSSGGRR